MALGFRLTQCDRRKIKCLFLLFQQSREQWATQRLCCSLSIHAVIENCFIAVTGVLLGLALLTFAVSHVDLRAIKLGWLSGPGLIGGESVWVLLLGACCGGLLSCIPVGIGLRKPLGLVLK